VLVRFNPVRPGPALWHPNDDHEAACYWDCLALKAGNLWFNSITQYVLEPEHLCVHIANLCDDNICAAFTILADTVNKIATTAVCEG
jgi:hypothetical protein